jgi:hypothetical protein
MPVTRVRWSIVVLAIATILASCRQATEVVIEARTNVTYRAGVFTSFTVGKPEETESAFTTTEAQEAWPADGFIGSLTVVPGAGDDAPIAVKLVMGVHRDAKTCAPPDYAGCIVARRRLRYVPHTKLALPITLYAACENVPCDSLTTCSYLGTCVDAAVVCDGDTCALAGDPGLVPPAPLDGASDAIIDAPSDVSSSGDAAFDAGAAGDIDCSSNMICHAPTHCCYRSTMGGNSCTPSPCAPPAITVACDGPEDCTATPGQECCTNQAVSQCDVKPCPSPQRTVCHTSLDCPGTVCVANAFGARYGTCQ